ncbi:MAG: AAA family ATPase [Patescibacteria group bacterium]
MKIENYKCLNLTIDELAIPNGIVGSGLNIFVGENATGKTSVLEVINLMVDSAYTIQNRLSINDFCNPNEPIVFDFELGSLTKFKLPETFRGSSVNAKGIGIEIKIRNNRSPGKLLSTPLQIVSKALTDDSNATTSTGGQSTANLDDFTLGFDVDRLEGGLNIFYFDKHRTRHVSKSSNYKNTFDRVLDDLSWKFHKKLRESITAENDLFEKFNNDFFELIIKTAQEGAGSLVANETAEFFNREDFKNVRIEFMNILSPFENAFFAMRKNDELRQIFVNKLGAGVEMIFSLLFLKSIASASRGKMIYLIDEPEISLHPQAQKKLFDIILELSKDSQVFVATHSPYFIDPDLVGNIFKFELDSDLSSQFKRYRDESLLTSKEKRIFDLEFSQIFFGNKIFAVEGFRDSERFSKFFSSIDQTFNDKYTVIKMDGKGDTKKYLKVLLGFDLDYKLILDLDVLTVKNDHEQNVISATFHGIFNEIADKITQLNKSDRNSLKTNMLSDNEKDLKIEIIGLLEDKNIFVLSDGEIEDYLDANGNPSDNDKKTELEEFIK